MAGTMGAYTTLQASILFLVFTSVGCFFASTSEEDQLLNDLTEGLKKMKDLIAKRDRELSELLGNIETQKQKLKTLLEEENILKSSIVGLTAKNAELNTKNEELTRNNKDMLKKNEELTTSNSDLITMNAKLMKEYEELTKKNYDLTKKNNELTIKNEELEKMNDELTRNNAELTPKNTALRTTNTDLMKNNEKLTIENNELTAKHTQLTANNTELNTANVKLTRKNDQLITDNAKLTHAKLDIESGIMDHCNDMIKEWETKRSWREYAMTLICVILICVLVHRRTVPISKVEPTREDTDTGGFISEDENDEADDNNKQILPSTSTSLRNRNTSITAVNITKKEKETVRNTSPKSFLSRLSKEFNIKIDLQSKFVLMKEDEPEYIQIWSIEESQLVVTKLVMVKTKKGNKEAISSHLRQGSVTIDAATADTLAAQYGEQTYREILITNSDHQTLIENVFESLPDLDQDR